MPIAILFSKYSYILYFLCVILLQTSNQQFALSTELILTLKYQSIYLSIDWSSIIQREIYFKSVICTFLSHMFLKKTLYGLDLFSHCHSLNIRVLFQEVCSVIIFSYPYQGPNLTSELTLVKIRKLCITRYFNRKSVSESFPTLNERLTLPF